MARTGRPSKMGSLIEVPGATDADPTRRITVAAYIYELMEQTGRSAERCARAAGVHLSTVDNWLAAGQQAFEKRERGHLLYPAEQRHLDFLLGTRRAHARWVNRMVELHRSVAAGGLRVGKVIEKVDTTQTDPNTGGPLVLERKVEQSIALPNARAIEWELERLSRDEFTPRVEVTGADGGPVEIDDRRSTVSRLMGELDAYEQGLADAHDRAAEQVNGSGAG